MSLLNKKKYFSLIIKDYHIFYNQLKPKITQFTLTKHRTNTKNEYSHNISLVYSRHLLPFVLCCKLKGELRHPLAGLLSDQLDGLHHAVDDLVFDARVLALCVLSYGDHVDIVV